MRIKNRIYNSTMYANLEEEYGIRLESLSIMIVSNVLDSFM